MMWASPAENGRRTFARQRRSTSRFRFRSKPPTIHQLDRLRSSRARSCQADILNERPGSTSVGLIIDPSIIATEASRDRASPALPQNRVLKHPKSVASASDSVAESNYRLFCFLLFLFISVCRSDLL